MNSLSNALEDLVNDARVRIAAPILAVVLCGGFLILGNVTPKKPKYGASSKTVSVLPEQPLDIPMLGRSETMSGADAILAWKQPAPKPQTGKQVVAAQAAGKKATKPVKGTLTARR